MNENKLIQKLEDYKKALQRLQDGLKKDVEEDDIILDGVIYRFKSIFEMSWKLMKNFLEYKGVINISSPRDAFREAYKNGLILNATEWLEMLEGRNRTSHTYDEYMALDIYKEIKFKFVGLMVTFEKEISEAIKKENLN